VTESRWEKWKRGWWILPAVALAGLLPVLTASAQNVPAKAPEAPSPAPLVGVVVASHALDLTARVEGRMREFKVHLGERVTAGQVLAALEVEPFQLEVSARKANLHAAEAEMQRNEVLLQQARERLTREQRIRDFTAAEALETAGHDVALAAANLAIAQSRLTEAQVRLELAVRDLDGALVRAPFAGFITERYLSPGGLVGRSTPLVRLVSEELRLRFAVPEAFAPRVRKGLQVRVRLPVLGATLDAQVESLAPEVDPATRHQKAEARLIIPEALRDQVAVGLLADISLPSHSAPAASAQQKP
jgi:membrane fusion protein, multidrug efflux system